MKRRKFIQKSVVAGISFVVLPSFLTQKNKNIYRLDLKTATKLFDGNSCWTHPRAGIIPSTIKSHPPKVVMTMNTLDLAGSDVFKGMYGLETSDLGENWTIPKELSALAPRTEKIDDVARPVAVSDFWPGWHKKTQRLLGTGHTVAYTPDWKVTNPRPRHTSYSVYDSNTKHWKQWQKLKMPNDPKFYNSGAGCVQRYDLDDGTILLPFSFKPIGRNAIVSVAKCSFDGQNLKYIRHGSELQIDDETRGLGEPSLTKFEGKYFLTIRNDKKGFITTSNDGLNFEEIKPWLFDDGTELGSYNTQQHWVTHSDALFLVYTRKGADNDHVFRNRAPLFMAKVDPEKLCVIRETEQILVPERGARLGNFGVTDVSENETWVTVSEWMQPEGVEKYGSDGSVFVARILWNFPNKLFAS